MSNKGTIRYTASISGVKLPNPLELLSGDKKVEKVFITTENDTNISATFTLTDVYTDKEATSLTKNVADLLFDRIAFKLSCVIGFPRCDGWSLPKQDGTKHVVVSSFVFVYDIAEATLIPGEKTQNELLTFLNKPYSDIDRLLPYFRFSISQKDPVSKFLFLYNLLLMLNQDKQANVDASILAANPNTPVTPHPFKREAMETIYTRLRNEVAHTRANVNQKQTVEEITNNVDGLRVIVTSALNDQN